MSFRSLDVQVDYTGWGGDILERFVLPLLREATQYDRVTSYFTTDSLIAIADGLDDLRERRGRMRLVLGLHDVPADLAAAALESEDPLGTLAAMVRERIIAGVATIGSELRANRLATIAWMMKDGLLEVRVAAPTANSAGWPGLFHNKAFIFRDADGDVVAAVGSPNETASGLGNNFEHLTAFTSWEQPKHTEAQVSFFSRLWGNNLEGLSSRPLGLDFAEEILRALGKHQVREPSATRLPLSIQAVLNAAARMPALAMVSGGHTALFPHQELAFITALSRWPVRVLLADEVGLGKTFEAGAILSFLLKHGGARRALVLAPKAVVDQWQAELTEHFGLDAWVFDSGHQALRSATGELRLLGGSESIFGPTMPPVIVMSAQYARGTRRAGHVLAGVASMPDVLIVDEAHAARVRPDLAGSERPTLLWRMLAEIAPRIPHVLFATATPMQIHWREYHALLEILGLPAMWARPKSYERSLEILSTDGPAALEDAKQTAELIRSCVEEMRPNRGALDEQEAALLTRLTASGTTVIDSALTALSDWPTARRLLIKLHPAHLLTVRNTRGALEAIGYRFPKRVLTAPALDVPSDVKAFYEKVEQYLRDVYFQVERALFPNRRFNVGFVQCTYQQRLASSLTACRESLLRRRANISQLLATGSEPSVEDGFDEFLESEFFDDEVLFELEGNDVAGGPEEVAKAARMELQYLDGLLRALGRILFEAPDPKVRSATQLVRKHLMMGDRVLVFSRYIDTLQAVIDDYLREFEGGDRAAYAVYTAKNVSYDLGVGPQDATRGAICTALAAGAVRILFCSDAAAEGLNLQAARVLINVDVPWNPARLEQRIGRIARLGQQSASVEIYNLWYPDSIEAKMYKMLMDRKDLYEVAVGEFPEVIGKAIRDEVTSRFGVSVESTDAIAELRRLKNDLQATALRRLWTQGASSRTMTSRFRSRLSGLAIAAVEAVGGRHSSSGDEHTLELGRQRHAYTTSPGSDSVISLTHPCLRWLAQRVPETNVGLPRVLCLRGAPLFFAPASGDERLPADPQDLPTQLGQAAALSHAEEGDAHVGILLPQADGQVLSDWLPRPSALSVPARLECEVPTMPEYRAADLKLGGIGVDGRLSCE